MASVRREDDGAWQRINRAGGGVEFAVKKFIEAAEGFRWFGEFRGVEAVGGDERGDFCDGGGAVHFPTVEAGEESAFDKTVEGHPPGQHAIGPAQERFAIDLFRLGTSGVAVEVANGLHGGPMVEKFRVRSRCRRTFPETGGPAGRVRACAGEAARSIAPAMNAVCFRSLAASPRATRPTGAVRCNGDGVRRARTTKDVVPKLFATSDERFREKQEVPVHGDKPTAWKELAATQFRLLNYRFGEAGEVWVSLSAGSVRENDELAWLRQFHAGDLKPMPGCASLRPGDGGRDRRSVGGSGGNDEGGMGSLPREGYALPGWWPTLAGEF